MRTCSETDTARNKSGGRKPPVVREPAIPKTIRFPFNADRHKSGGGNAIATPSANTPDDSLPSNCGSAFASALPIRHGGLTLAALGYACDNRLRMCANYPRRRGCRTPRRAHVRRSCCVCVCTSQKSQFSRWENAPEQERGGVSPPWGTIIALAGECVFRRSTHAVRSGGREPPVANLATHLQGRCAIAREWRCAEGTRAAGVSKRRMASREWFLGLANGCSPFIIRYAPFAIGDSPTTQRFSHQLARRISGLLLGGGICGC